MFDLEHVKTTDRILSPRLVWPEMPPATENFSSHCVEGGGGGLGEGGGASGEIV